MWRSVVIRFATFALMAPIALLLAAMPSTPVAATNKGEAAALCKKNQNCLGWSTPDGGWAGQVCNPGDECRTVACPKKGECTVDRRRGTKALGILKPPTAGMKPPSAGLAGPKKTSVPAAGAKFPTGSNRPPSFQPSGGGKRR